MKNRTTTKRCMYVVYWPVHEVLEYYVEDSSPTEALKLVEEGIGIKVYSFFGNTSTGLPEVVGWRELREDD